MKGATPRSAKRETKVLAVLRRPGFHRAKVDRLARGDGEMFLAVRGNMQFSASRPDGAPRQGISEPQCAFEVSMFTESCNSHQFSRLAALFIDGRAE